jgi:hypothetical protein
MDVWQKKQRVRGGRRKRVPIELLAFVVAAVLPKVNQHKPSTTTLTTRLISGRRCHSHPHRQHRAEISSYSLLSSPPRSL